MLNAWEIHQNAVANMIIEQDLPGQQLEHSNQLLSLRLE